MKKKCRIPACQSPAASQFAAYCNAHKAAARRHGAPDQPNITKAALQPYLKRVTARIAKNPHSNAWAILDQRWQALVVNSQRHVDDWYSGRPGSRIERAAAFEICKLHKDDKGRDVIATTAAMIWMQQDEPRRFKSDDAFWTQLSRRARALTYMNVGESYNHKTGRVKRHYRDLTPKAAVALGRLLAKTLGIAGIHMAKLERADEERRSGERAALNEALSSLS